MGAPLNCWEFFECGRQEGGGRTFDLGVCPAASERSAHGINRGSNAGRACWTVAGTLCGDCVQGTFAMKRVTCTTCAFFKHVEAEEAEDFSLRRRPGLRGV